MQIHVGEDRGIVLSDVFNGVGIETDQGHFGIAQRDAGIEVMLDGVLVWSSSGTDTTELDHLRARSKLCDEILRELGKRWKDADLPQHFARVVQERNEARCSVLTDDELRAFVTLLGWGWRDALGDLARDQDWSDEFEAGLVAKLKLLEIS